MKAKRLFATLGLIVVMVVCFAFAACQPETPPKPIQYTVTFDANGGTLTGDKTVTVESGKTVTSAPTAAKADHTFDGWFTAAEGGDKVALDSYKVSADVTLYAHYTKKSDPTPPTPPTPTKAKITFDANGGTIDGNNVVEVDDDGLVLDTPTATRSGYRFDAWYTAAEGGEAYDPMFDETTADKTLYAHWVKVCTVTFDANGGTLQGEATVTVDEGGKIVSVPTASKNGEEFHGWYTAATEGELVDFEQYTVNADVTIYAHFGVLTMPVKTLKDHEGTKVGYRIEAEDAKFAGELGQGNSGTNVESDIATASGQKSIGFINVVGNTITFTFKSAAAGKATISLRATSNNTQMIWGPSFSMWVDDQTVTNADFTVKFNGADVNFEPAKLRGAGIDRPMTWNLYWDPISFGELDVKEGVNEIVLTVAATTVPNMDCLDIETTLDITSANGAAASGEAQLPEPPAPDVAYDKDVAIKLIVGGYEGGPAIEKAILTFTEEIPATALDHGNPFAVSLGGAKLGGNNDNYYLCDEQGNKLVGGSQSYHVAIEYAVSYGQWSFNNNLSPFAYNQQTARNNWKDMTSATITVSGLVIGETEYTKFGGATTSSHEVPCLTGWKLDGTFSDTITWGDETARKIDLTYGAYEPAALKSDSGKNALIVWLHGGGEGGTDPSIALLGNQVTSLSNELVQKYFKQNGLAGAYVLAPQTPTRWMDIGDGAQAFSPENSVYTESLFKLIKKYAEELNNDVDINRIYIGGCSNGGWMTLELLADHGEYFAAAYPVSACYDTQYITDEMIAKLKNIPIWFTHSKADGTLPIVESEFRYYNEEHPEWGGQNVLTDKLKNVNTNELYIKLVNAGATNVYYSLFENVTANGTTYDGHWSWIYTFRDECKTVQPHTGTGTDGALTLNDLTTASTATVSLTEGGEAVTMWQWIAAQHK